LTAPELRARYRITPVSSPNPFPFSGRFPMTVIVDASHHAALAAPFHISQRSTSTARNALAVHLDKLRTLHAERAQKREPLIELDARIEKARADIVVAEQSQLAVHAAEAQSIIENGHGAAFDHAEAVNKAQQRVDLCQRVLAALEGKREEVRHGMRDTELTVSVESSATEALIAAVVSETADLAFSKMQEAREAAAKAEAAWHTLRAHLANKRWFPVVERMNVKFNTTPIPRWEDQNDFPDWARFVDALGNDANAQVQL
jgi:hypothetical protein